MRVTRSQLRRIILQEAASLTEAPSPVVPTQAIRDEAIEAVEQHEADFAAFIQESYARVQAAVESLVPPGSQVMVSSGSGRGRKPVKGTVVEVRVRENRVGMGTIPEIHIVVDYQAPGGRTSRRAFPLEELHPVIASFSSWVHS